MKLFSAPPMRTSVGAEGDCNRLGVDPKGLSGRPYDTTQAMTSIKKFKAFSPFCVKWIAIPVFKQSPDGAIYEFHALDALGQWWYGSVGNEHRFEGTKSITIVDGDKLIKAGEPGSDNSNWFEKAVQDVGQALLQYGVPILAAALATTGVGVIGSVALLAWRNIAMGQSLTDAIINAEQTKLAPSPSALDAFNQGLAKAEDGLSNAAYQAAVKALPSVSTSNGPRDAFNHAVQIVRSKQVQDLTVASLGTVLSGDEMNRLNLALKWGAPLADAMTGIRGVAGDKLLSGTSEKAATFVAANVATPEKIAAAVASPTTLRTLVGNAPPIKGQSAQSLTKSVPSGGSGGSSSSGLGTAIVVGVGGFAVYKLWPRIMNHFGHPGVRRR